jgi:hypothetical protein
MLNYFYLDQVTESLLKTIERKIIKLKAVLKDAGNKKLGAVPSNRPIERRNEVNEKEGTPGALTPR